MMAELIDRNALIDALMTFTWRDEDEHLIDDWDEKRKFIEDWLPSLPTIEAEPLRHGHWIEKDGFDGDTYYDCSACGHSWVTIEGTPQDNEMNYCPYCGAHMDEVTE